MYLEPIDDDLDLIDNCGAYEALGDMIDAEDEFDEMDDDEILEFVDTTDAQHAAYVKDVLSDDEDELVPLEWIEDQLNRMEAWIADVRQEIFDARMNDAL